MSSTEHDDRDLVALRGVIRPALEELAGPSPDVDEGWARVQARATRRGRGPGLLAVAAVVLVLVGLVAVVRAGVGGEDELVVAAERTLGAGTARVAMGWVREAGAEGAPPGEETRLKGVVDFAAGTAHLRSDDGFEILVTPDAGYFRLPGSDTPPEMDPLGLGDKWFPLDEDGAGAAAALVAFMSPAGPVASLGSLGGTGTVTRDGRELVRGVATTRYVITDGDLAVVFGTAAEDHDAVGPFSGVVWIDDDNLVRRFWADGHEPHPEDPDQQVAFSLTFEYWDFGVDVTIIPPGPDELFNPAELGFGFPGGEPFESTDLARDRACQAAHTMLDSLDAGGPLPAEQLEALRDVANDLGRAGATFDRDPELLQLAMSARGLSAMANLVWITASSGEPLPAELAAQYHEAVTVDAAQFCA